MTDIITLRMTSTQIRQIQAIIAEWLYAEHKRGSAGSLVRPYRVATAALMSAHLSAALAGTDVLFAEGLSNE